MEERRDTYFIENEVKVNRVLIKAVLSTVLLAAFLAFAKWKMGYASLEYIDDLVILLQP